MARENVGLLLSGPEALVTQRVEEAEVLTAFFAPNFTSKTVLWKAETPKTR